MLKNHIHFLNAREHIDVTALAKIKSYIEAIEDNDLAQEVLPSKEALELHDDVWGILEAFFRRVDAHKRCPRCGSALFFSDLIDYDYVCPSCDENYYECEVKEN